MPKDDKPRFGEWVRFTHFSDKPTDEEIQARGDELDGEEGTMERVRRENPAPDIQAMVVGVTSVPFEGELLYNDYGRAYVNWQGHRRCRFYVLKHSLRGRRFCVALEDIQRGGATP